MQPFAPERVQPPPPPLQYHLNSDRRCDYITNPARLLTSLLGRSEPPAPAVTATELSESFNGTGYEFNALTMQGEFE